MGNPNVVIETTYGKRSYHFISSANPTDAYENLFPELLLREVLELTPVRVDRISEPALPTPQGHSAIEYSYVHDEVEGFKHPFLLVHKTKIPETLSKRCLEGISTEGYLVRQGRIPFGFLVNLGD